MNGFRFGLLLALLTVPGFRASAEDGNPAAGDKSAAVVESDNQFAFDLYARLRERPGNFCVSPASLATGLAMLQAGARGETAGQIGRVLHLSADAAPAVGPPAHGGPEGVRLISANSLWGQKGLGFLPEYLAVLKERFRSELNEVDFQDDPDVARRAVNTWVAGHTDGKVKELYKPGDVNGETQLVLVNALTFQGSWVSAFRKERTTPDAFRVSAGRQVMVPFMRQTGKFRVTTIPSGRALELPYLGHEVALVVLLPDKADGLADLEAKLTATALAERLRWLKPESVSVSLPRFTVATERHLKQDLSALGMPLALRAGEADFSGLSATDEPFALTDVTQHVFLEVEEAGTAAVAATSVRAGRGLPGPAESEFRADHPFLFFLQDQRTGVLLFLGRLSDPAP